MAHWTPTWLLPSTLRTIVGTDVELFKDASNYEYRIGRYLEAYSKCLAVCKDDGVRAVVLSNRSECYLKEFRYEDALRDVDAASLLLPDHAKSWYRKGRALEALTAAASFSRAGELLNHSNEDAESSYQRATTLANDVHGTHDLTKYFATYPKLSTESFQGADFVGPVTIRMTPDGRGGIFTTSNVAAGDLLMVMAPRTLLLQVYSMVDTETVPSMEMFKPGSAAAAALDDHAPLLQVDVVKIENAVVGLIESQLQTEMGLFRTLSSFFNCSCVPNVGIYVAGDALCCFASRNMTELERPFCNVLLHLEKRAERTPWDCNCKRCSLEKRLFVELKGLSRKQERMLEVMSTAIVPRRSDEPVRMSSEMMLQMDNLTRALTRALFRETVERTKDGGDGVEASKKSRMESDPASTCETFEIGLDAYDEMDLEINGEHKSMEILINKAEIRFSACEEERWLAESSSRNRKRVKEARVCVKGLPGLTQELQTEIAEWEKTHTQFLNRGVSLAKTLQSYTKKKKEEDRTTISPRLLMIIIWFLGAVCVDAHEADLQDGSLFRADSRRIARENAIQSHGKSVSYNLRAIVDEVVQDAVFKVAVLDQKQQEQQICHPGPVEILRVKALEQDLSSSASSSLRILVDSILVDISEVETALKIQQHQHEVAIAEVTGRTREVQVGTEEVQLGAQVRIRGVQVGTEEVQLGAQVRIRRVQVGPEETARRRESRFQLQIRRAQVRAAQVTRRLEV